jgi:hypothetical protein
MLAAVGRGSEGIPEHNEINTYLSIRFVIKYYQMEVMTVTSQDSGFRIQDSEVRSQNSGARIQDSRSPVVCLPDPR